MKIEAFENLDCAEKNRTLENICEVRNVVKDRRLVEKEVKACRRGRMPADSIDVDHTAVSKWKLGKCSFSEERRGQLMEIVGMTYEPGIGKICSPPTPFFRDEGNLYSDFQPYTYLMRASQAALDLI